MLKKSCFVNLHTDGSGRSHDKLFLLHFIQRPFPLYLDILSSFGSAPSSQNEGLPLPLPGFIVCFIYVRRSVGLVVARLVTIHNQHGRNKYDSTSRVENTFSRLILAPVRRCPLLPDVPATHDLVQSHHHYPTRSSRTRGQTLL